MNIKDLYQVIFTQSSTMKNGIECVMVLMDNVVEITGYTMVTGWSPQNNASTNGYIDVRTGKHYPYHESIFVDINKY